MINWTGEDKPPQRPSSNKTPSRSPSSEWEFGYRVKDVQESIRAKQEKLFRFSGIRPKQPTR